MSTGERADKTHAELLTEQPTNVSYLAPEVNKEHLELRLAVKRRIRRFKTYGKKEIHTEKQESESIGGPVKKARMRPKRRRGDEKCLPSE